MKYASISDLNFAIAVLQISASKIPEESYAKLRVTASINRVVFELQDIIKQLEIEAELEKEKTKDFRSKIEN